MTPEEREYREGRFEEVVVDPGMRDRLRAHLSFTADPGEPAVTEGDIQAGRLYLKRCMESMSTNELAQKRRDELAALWARGALGAARFRMRHRPQARAPKKTRSDSEADRE